MNLERKAKMSVLLAPDTGRGHGSAHLRRAIGLLNALPDSKILIDSMSPRLSSMLAGIDPGRITDRLGGRWNLIIVDRFSAERETIQDFLRHGCTVGIDLGGGGRAYCDYLIDTLVRLDDAAVNVADSTLLDLPEATQDVSRQKGTILVTFGGEDPAHLTESVAQLLSTAGFAAGVTVVAPTMRTLGRMPAGLEVLPPQPTLEPLLRRADRVITAFGMTAYEATASGAAVVTVAPTRYHDRLARKAGFRRAGVGRPNRGRLLAGLGASCTDEQRLPNAPRRSSARSGPRLLARLPAERSLPARRGCPAHPESFGPAVWRDPEKSYFRCPRCGIVYLERFAPDEESYGASYFMEEYRAQYGRTYLEDFDHIAAMGTARLARARRVAPGELATVLDVGCAYGPFLCAAAREGLDACGVDVAQEAIAHVRTLGIEAVCGSILDPDTVASLEREVFDLVTLWYVVEHFDRLDELLPRLSRLVRPGGVLAMSTPYGRGVSARRSPDQFYRSSPRDHFTIWDRPSARRILREYGFRVRRSVVTGHHPERYPLVRHRGTGLTERVALGHSRLFGWGDTFEIYAVREGR